MSITGKIRPLALPLVALSFLLLNSCATSSAGRSMGGEPMNMQEAAEFMEDVLEASGLYTEITAQDFDGNRSPDFVFTYNEDTRNMMVGEVLASITGALGPTSDNMIGSYDKAVVLIQSDVWIGSAEDLRLCYIMVLEEADDETLGNCVINNWYLISE